LITDVLLRDKFLLVDFVAKFSEGFNDEADKGTKIVRNKPKDYRQMQFKKERC